MPGHTPFIGILTEAYPLDLKVVHPGGIEYVTKGVTGPP